MAAKAGGYNVGTNLIGEFVDDVGSFKIVRKARDPKSFPATRDLDSQLRRKRDKKAKKKKDK